MEIIEVTPKEYDSVFKKALCFNKADFNILNAKNCDEILFLFFKDKKVRLGLIAGINGQELSSPFSAPFGGFSTLDSRINIPYIEDSVNILEEYCLKRNITTIKITLPPLFYDSSFLTKVTHVLYQKNWNLDQLDLNYYYNLNLLSNKEDTISRMSVNARNKLTNSLKHQFTFEYGSTKEMLEEAFEIVSINRENKGYPLKMTLQQMIKTSEVVPIKSFIVRLKGKPVASAIVYQVNPIIPLVVYWGDLPEFTSYRTMNFLTYKIFEHFFEKGYRLLDVGTAMIENLPNYGLCEFKESLGCNILPRCCFTKELNIYQTEPA